LVRNTHIYYTNNSYILSLLYNRYNLFDANFFLIIITFKTSTTWLLADIYSKGRGYAWFRTYVYMGRGFVTKNSVVIHQKQMIQADTLRQNVSDCGHNRKAPIYTLFKMKSLLGGDQFSSGGSQSPPTSIDHVTKAPVACPVHARVIYANAF